MNKTELAQLAARIRECIDAGNPAQAVALTEPVLRGGLSSAALNDLGFALAQAHHEGLHDYCERLAETATPAAWRVLAAALEPQVDYALYWSLGEARHFIRQTNAVQPADLIATRVVAPALARYPDAALAVLQEWRGSRSPFVRRALGIAARDWAAAPNARAGEAQMLVNLLGGLAGETNRPAAQGVLAGFRALAARWPRAVQAWAKRHPVEGRRPTWLERQLILNL